MNELQMKKFELEGFHGFLLGLKLKGKQNRHRMRIIKELESAMDAFQKDMSDLAEEFALKDEDGNPVIIKKERDGEMFDAYDIEDIQQFAKEKLDLSEETFVLDGKKYQEELQTLLVAMDESEIELSGNEAIIEQLVYERIEKAL
ncbi:DUF1617 family protein [Exiguobacterium sp. SH5S4]|uniref:DUF1617 family protein n=1 Tax=Exiguobacterium sp. SH5S4 TaxID=2510961 RepID=UPI00137606DF|nr:DUF1617 family protein [Exiguobacterium sp. SH5S4]